jgi:hypothetical protein
MKISRGFALASLLTLAASPVFAQFSLGDAANAISGMKSGNTAADAAPTSETADLLGALSQLSVTPQQAVGGTGAMLGLAKNQLSSTDYSQLAKSVPGIDKLSGGGELGALAGLLGSSLARPPGWTTPWATSRTPTTSTAPSAHWAWTAA